jgi:hypothetical protein
MCVVVNLRGVFAYASFYDVSQSEVCVRSYGLLFVCREANRLKNDVCSYKLKKVA